jgi:signal transduction histidine kinase/ActR/RegA family two-component response regulator
MTRISRFQRLSLSARFSLATIAMIVITSASLAGYFALQTVERGQRDLREQGRALASLVGRSGELAIYTGDARALRSILEGLAAYRNVAWAMVLDPDHAELARWTSEPGIAVPRPPPRGAFGELGSARVWTSDTIDTVVMVSPVVAVADPNLGDLVPEQDVDAVIQERIGYVLLGMSTAELIVDQRTFLLSVFLVTLGLALIGALVAVLLARRIAAPLKSLASAAGRISTGDLDIQIERGSGGEVTSLAEAFEHMLVRLRSYRERVAAQQQDLEDQVAQRTEDLRLALGQAQQANQSKSQFLARMSHELRTPLHGLLGAVEVLAAASDPAERADLARLAIDVGTTLKEIIDDVLDLSRAESNRLELELRAFDVGQIVREVRDVLSGTAQRKGVDLRVEIDPQLPGDLLGDSSRIKQVVLNLVSNAVKFTQQGEVRLSARVIEASAELTELRIEVADTGIGIAPQAVERVFEPFAQADESMSRRFGGTGLGLALSRQLVEMMGGRIGVDSEPGLGSVFWVQLSLASASSSGSPQVSQEVFADAQRSEIPSTWRILVAEDNPVNQLVVRRFLNRLGLEPVVVDHGQAALAAIDGQRFDLVFMDCQMPQMDGYEATRRIRDAERTAQGVQARLPIVALTAHATRSERQRCLDAGMDDFVTKPFSVDDLRQVIARWLDAESCA